MIRVSETSQFRCGQPVVSLVYTVAIRSLSPNTNCYGHPASLVWIDIDAAVSHPTGAYPAERRADVPRRCTRRKIVF